MTRATVDALRDHALTFPEAWEDFPWEHSVAKVGKKVFVFLPGPADPLESAGISVKLPESGEAALLSQACAPTGYGLGRSGWVALELPDPVPAAEWEEIAELIETSYRLVAPKTLVRKLDGA